jgi:hypothetical protein
VSSAVARAAAAFGLIAALALGTPGALHAQESCDLEDLSAPCPLADGITVLGTIRGQGGRNYFWFGAPQANAHLHVELVDLPADYDLYVFSDQSPDPTRPFLQSVTLGLAPEVIDSVLTEAGTYVLEVVSDPGLPFDPEQPYTLTFGLVLPPPPPPTPEPPAPAPTPTPEPERAIVPPLIGHGGGAAEAEVRAAGLVALVQSADRFSPTGAGTVAAQEPPAGALVSPGSSVDVFLATGNVEVPSVSGLTEQAATNLLQASGLQVTTRRTISSTVPAGLAVGSPSTGQVLRSGSSVVLLISQH